jgi:hypothetical protein
MGLKEVFLNAVEVAFTVFEDAVKAANHVVTTDDGFVAEPVEVLTPVRIILEAFSQEDIENLPFSKQIQPTDIKGLIPGVDLIGVEVKTSNDVSIVDGDSYTLVAFTKDAYSALYTCLLRDS